MHCLNRFRRCQSGAVALEFALVSLLFVAVAIGVMEFGRGLNVRSKLSHAIDAGARKVLINPAITDGQLDSDLRAAFAGSKPNLLQVQIGQETAGGLTFRVVTLRYPLSPLIPNITNLAINISVNRRVPQLTY